MLQLDFVGSTKIARLRPLDNDGERVHRRRGQTYREQASQALDEETAP